VRKDSKGKVGRAQVGGERHLAFTHSSGREKEAGKKCKKRNSMNKQTQKVLPGKGSQWPNIRQLCTVKGEFPGPEAGGKPANHAVGKDRQEKRQLFDEA